MKYLISLLFIAFSLQISAQKHAFSSSTFSVPVSNLEQSIKWYKQLLGEVDYFSPAEGVIEFALNEKTWLQLFEGVSSANSILRLEVSDIQLHHARLKKLEASPTPIALVPNVVSYFDFKDPDGNLLSFYKLELP